MPMRSSTQKNKPLISTLYTVASVSQKKDFQTCVNQEQKYRQNACVGLTFGDAELKKVVLFQSFSTKESVRSSFSI